MKHKEQFINYKSKYINYKRKYLARLGVGGKCKPFSQKDCKYDSSIQKCTQVKYDINLDQNKCICNYQSGRCVLKRNKPGKYTLDKFKEELE